MPENNQKPIFIMGCERSGTTLIRLILHSHPNIALPPQTKFLKKIYKRRLQWLNLANEANRIKLSHWFTDHFDNHTKLPDLGLESGDICKEIVSSATSLGAAATGVFKLYSRKFNKPLFFLQPGWNNEKGGKLAYDYVRTHSEWRLSIQTHKWLDVL